MMRRLLTVAGATMLIMGLLAGASGASEKAGIPTNWDPFKKGIVRMAGDLVEGDTKTVFDGDEAVPIEIRVFIKRQPDKAGLGAVFVDWVLTCSVEGGVDRTETGTFRLAPHSVWPKDKRVKNLLVDWVSEFDTCHLGATASADWMAIYLQARYTGKPFSPDIATASWSIDLVPDLPPNQTCPDGPPATPECARYQSQLRDLTTRFGVMGGVIAANPFNDSQIEKTVVTTGTAKLNGSVEDLVTTAESLGTWSFDPATLVVTDPPFAGGFAGATITGDYTHCSDVAVPTTEAPCEGETWTGTFTITKNN